jgi:hypothetical protein
MNDAKQDGGREQDQSQHQDAHQDEQHGDDPFEQDRVLRRV